MRFSNRGVIANPLVFDSSSGAAPLGASAVSSETAPFHKRSSDFDGGDLLEGPQQMKQVPPIIYEAIIA